MERRAYSDYSTEEIVADIAEKSAVSSMPEHMQDSMHRFFLANRAICSEGFTTALWAVSRMLGERTGLDAELALRHAVIALLRAATYAARATNDALGKPVDPGRVAMVAWTVAGAELDLLAEMSAPPGLSEKLLRAMAKDEDGVFGTAAPADIAKTPEG